MQYCLISLMFSSHLIDAEDIFRVASEIAQRFDPAEIDHIEAAVLDMTPEAVNGYFKKGKKDLVYIFKEKLIWVKSRAKEANKLN